MHDAPEHERVHHAGVRAPPGEATRRASCANGGRGPPLGELYDGAADGGAQPGRAVRPQQGGGPLPTSHLRHAGPAALPARRDRAGAAPLYPPI
eukprot:9284273-Pyramimonas_sp.AAC.1